ncbi:KRAB A domain containing protein [Echinococcus multilocularis]|uniref:KRAB A domain containing protein n=1 Tax=Echinococcus multilocularis TaxID=6211 RepID=A0A068YGL2_ECHMU|nr:KRAB A domain containing protein [Echinococcus multilocularis]
MALMGPDISHIGPDHMRPRHRSIYEAANLCEAIKVETRTAGTEESRGLNIGLRMPEGQAKAKAKYKGGKYSLGKVKCYKYTIPIFSAVSITRRLVLGDVDFTLCQHRLGNVSAVVVDDAVGAVKILSPSTKLCLAEGREMIVDEETLLKVGLGKETWTVKFIVYPELAWDVILGADFLRYTKAVLNFAEGTFSTHEATGVNKDTSPPKDDAGGICNALFEAAVIPMNDLDDLCSQLTHISNYKRKELHQLLLKSANIFSWQGARLGRANIVKHKIDTGEARPIWQPSRRIPPPLLEEVNRLVEEMLQDETV